MKKQLLMVVAALVMAAGAMAQKVENISPATLDSMAQHVKKAQIIDVRTPKEYAEGHIANAVNYNISDTANFDLQTSKLKKKAPLLIYCRSGKRSLIAAKRLAAKGYTNVYNMEGGILRWKREERSLVQ